MVRRPPAVNDLRRLLNRGLSVHGVLIALIVVLIALAIVAPNFYAPVNVSNTLRRSAMLGLITVGQFTVMLVRGIDLSVAAMAGFAVVAITTVPNPWLGLLLSLGVAAMVGTVNALLVVKRKVPAFVATFGMLMVLEGARLLWTRGSISSEVPQEFVQIARGTVGPVPIPVIFWVLLTALAVFWVRKTASGRQLVLSGASPRMAGLSGIALGRNQWISFLAAAVLAVIGGVLLAGHAGYIDRATGQGLELDSITAAILGGARFIGGEGSYVGAALGALLLGVISTALVVLALPPELQNIIKGVVLLVALALHRMVAR